MHGVTEICPECQFDPTTVVDAEMADLFAKFAKRYPIPLTRLLPSDSPAILTTRPEPATWSAQEYVGHAAQCFEETAKWITTLQAGGEAKFAGSGVDAAVLDAAFNDCSATAVAERVAASASTVAELLSTLSVEDFTREVGFGEWNVPFRMLLFAQIHEGHHHLLDVGRILRAQRNRPAAE
jgi:DinB superfamily